MKNILLPIVLILVCTAATTAQRTTRGRNPRPVVTVAERIATPAADTICGDSLGIRISGYDKTLSARRESFFVQNMRDSGSVVWLSVTIDYADEQDRPLHSRRAHIRTDVPAGATRRVDIPAWDRQGVYFYRGSEPRRRVNAAAAPFTVRFRIDSIALTR